MNRKSILSVSILVASTLFAPAFAQEGATTAAPTAAAPATAPVAVAPATGTIQVAGEPTQVPGNMASPSQATPGWVNFALIGGIILFMWLFVFRPQSKRAKEQKEFLSALAPGNEVITAGGVVGTIVEVKDNIVSLNVGSTQLRVLKSSISGKLDGAAPAAQK